MDEAERERSRVQQTQTLARNSARLYHTNWILTRLLHLFTDLTDVTRVANSILDLAMDTVKCEAGSLLRVVSEAGDLRFVAARGPVGDKLVGVELDAGQGLAGACARDNRLIAVSDVTSDPRHAAGITAAHGFETKSILAAPLVHEGRVTGVIELINRKEGDEFPRQEIKLVERVARSAGTMLALADALSRPAAKAPARPRKAAKKPAKKPAKKKGKKKR